MSESNQKENNESDEEENNLSQANNRKEMIKSREDNIEVHQYNLISKENSKSCQQEVLLLIDDQNLSIQESIQNRISSSVE